MTADATRAIDHIAVIGAGTMGHGIAQVAAAAGYDTTLTDVDGAALERARQRIEASLGKLVTKGGIAEADRDAALARLHLEPDLEQATREADLVVEAVVEDLEVKRQLFRRLEGITGGRALLASNTSSIPIAQIAAACEQPAQVVGMHFFNPVPLLPLIEIIHHEGTASEARETAVAVGRRLGKDPIVVRDSPGFASSRLGVVLALEAMRMVEQGVASAADIDKAMELGYRHPMGPLKVTDLVGLDVRLAIAETLATGLDGDHYRPPDILRRKVAAGELGKKSGRGFYDWSATE